MPFNSNDELPKGVKNLPKGQQTKWRKVFNAAYSGTCKDEGDRRDECASRVAWSQIDDKYKGKSSMLNEFSMAIRSATHDKQKDTLRWKAVASDTDEDFYHDNMSLELFNDFARRIEIKELVPEEFRSSFWSGGEPYLSVSHYSDLDGEAVPGISEKTFVDGNQLKSYGLFNKTPIGFASYHAICKDLYAEPKPENPIRISIAFLDWGHVHKSNGYEFERECIDDICPECVMERTRGEFPGRIFKKGQLVHEALTRVPANERTSMEVEKSMTTRKEDAISIIGEELADEIDKKAKLTKKSLADETPDMLVVKVEEEEIEPEEITEEELDELEGERQELEDEILSEEEKSSSKKGTIEKDYPVPVVIVNEPSEYKPFGGATSMSEAKKFREAQKEQWRVSDLWWAFQAVMDNILDDMEVTNKTKAIGTSLKELQEMLGDKSAQMLSIITRGIVEEPEHELNTVFSDFRAVFDDIKAQSISSDEKLQQLQTYFNEFAQGVINCMKTEEPKENQIQEEPEGDNLVQTLSQALEQALTPLVQKVDLLLAQQRQENVVKSIPAIPVQRSIAPSLSMQKDIHKELQPQKSKVQSETPNLDKQVRRRLGLPE